jgi:transcription antitermination factor NusG
MTERWYVAYTKPNWEKKVAGILTAKNIENYCPLNTVTRQWRDRKKVIYEPLFYSYVFIRVTEKKIGDIKKIDGILNFVYWLGRPAVVKDAEIEAIKNFLGEHKNIQLEKTVVNVNDTVQILSGPLIERTGNILTIKGSTVRVSIPSLGYLMVAEVEKEQVKVLSNNEVHLKKVINA